MEMPINPYTHTVQPILVFEDGEKVISHEFDTQLQRQIEHILYISIRQTSKPKLAVESTAHFFVSYIQDMKKKYSKNEFEDREVLVSQLFLGATEIITKNQEYIVHKEDMILLINKLADLITGTTEYGQINGIVYTLNTQKMHKFVRFDVQN